MKEIAEGLSPKLVVHCTDGTSYEISRADISKKVLISDLQNAAVAILVEEGKEGLIGMAKIYYFSEDGIKPQSCLHIFGEVLTFTEEIVDCRKAK